MKLELRRVEFYGGDTIGKLYVDGVFECFTLEDTIRTGAKVYGQTAIPVGTYTVTLELSSRFKIILPLLHNVPQFEGVRIHSGNYPKDTEGCILVGTTERDTYIEESKLAFKKLMSKLSAATSPITIHVS